MAKWLITIDLVERYKNKVVVEAENLDEAIKKVEEEWASETYLYENTTDMMEDQEVRFLKCGLATEEQIKSRINID